MTQRKNTELPQLNSGESCVPDQLYRMDCNTCKCSLDNVLLCSKMACLKKEDFDKVKMIYRKAKNNGNTNKNKFPSLPPGNCIPGKIYQKKCRKCFCDNSKKATCSKIESCKTKLNTEVPITLAEIRPEHTAEEFEILPELPNAASKCDPGGSYKVDCNSCLCMANRNMICTHMLCLSTEDMNRLDAEKHSGLVCQNNEDMEGPSCIKCSCVKGITKCIPIEGCVPTTVRRSLHGHSKKIKPRLTLSLEKKENCVPSAIYKDDCNKCYCQPDGTLRCTQKTCLNYVQSLKLKKHRLYLEKHGL